MNFTTGQRYNGTLPDDRRRAAARVPVHAARGRTSSAATTWASTPTLHTPYSFNANVSVARELRGGMTVEVGYVGRWGRDLLMQIDAGGWAILFKDPASGQTWKEMAQQIRAIHDAGIDAGAGARQPGADRADPVDREHGAGAGQHVLPGQRHRQLLRPDLGPVRRQRRRRHARHRPRPLGGVPELHHQDRLLHDVSDAEQRHVDVDQRRLLELQRRARSRCARRYSKGYLVRRQLHAVALAWTTAARPKPGGGSAAGIMLNPYDLDAFYGDSDFDVRHNLNSNVLFELPFGQGKPMLGNAGALTDALVGGWQLSTHLPLPLGPADVGRLLAASGRRTSRSPRSPTRSATTTTA